MRATARVRSGTRSRQPAPSIADTAKVEQASSPRRSMRSASAFGSPTRSRIPRRIRPVVEDLVAATEGAPEPGLVVTIGGAALPRRQRRGCRRLRACHCARARGRRGRVRGASPHCRGGREHDYRDPHAASRRHRGLIIHGRQHKHYGELGKDQRVVGAPPTRPVLPRPIHPIDQEIETPRSGYNRRGWFIGRSGSGSSGWSVCWRSRGLLSCGDEKLQPGKDAGSEQVVGGAGGAGGISGGAAGAGGHGTGGGGMAGGGAGQSGGASGQGGRASGTAGSEGSVTEWSIPFADSQPFPNRCIRDQCFLPEQRVRTDARSSRHRERHGDRMAPVQSRDEPGRRRLRRVRWRRLLHERDRRRAWPVESQSQLLQRWPLPLDVAAGDWPGPWSIAFDASDRVIFSAYDANGPLVGRLDTTNGHLDVWSSPEGGPVRVRSAPDGTVIFPTMGPEFDVVRLESSDRRIHGLGARRSAALGVCRRWLGELLLSAAVVRFPGAGAIQPRHGPPHQLGDVESIPVRLAGPALRPHLLSSPSPTTLEALDPAVAGTDTVLSPTDTQTVPPRTSVVTPTMETLSGQQASAQVTQGTAQRQTTGAFSIWSLPDAPRMVATVPGAVYYTDDAARFIARLTVGTL